MLTFDLLGHELHPQRHAGGPVDPPEQTHPAGAPGIPTGLGGLSAGTGHQLRDAPLGARGPAVPHWREHRGAVLHRQRVSGSHPGRGSCRYSRSVK